MLNKVTLIGRLGVDPEVRYMPSGGAVTNIRLATSRRWKDKQSGERREETEWHRVAFFNRLAEIAGHGTRAGQCFCRIDGNREEQLAESDIRGIVRRWR